MLWGTVYELRYAEYTIAFVVDRCNMGLENVVSHISDNDLSDNVKILHILCSVVLVEHDCMRAIVSTIALLF